MFQAGEPQRLGGGVGLDDAVLLLGLQRRVGAGEVDLAGDELLDAGAGAGRVVVDRGARGTASRKLEAASSKAFFCAEEPSAFRVPSKQSADAAEPVAEELEPEPVLLSEPQPARAIEPTRARAATWPRR